MRPIDLFYSEKEEPTKGCLEALRKIILSQNAEITEAWKYGMPFFCYKNKMFCYLWINKKTLQPYLGIVEGNRINHPELIQEKRARMKIMLFDANKDLSLTTIKSILEQAINLYESGDIKIK